MIDRDKFGKDWTEWWENHRHSGFCYKHDPRLGREVYHWNETPQTAFTILRYRVEFEDQTGISTGLSSEKFNLFTCEERRKWREDQAESDRFAEEYGFTLDADNNQRVWDANFHDAIEIIRETIKQLSKKCSVREQMEREDKEFSEAEIEQQINTVDRKFTERSKKATQI